MQSCAMDTQTLDDESVQSLDRDATKRPLSQLPESPVRGGLHTGKFLQGVRRFRTLWHRLKGFDGRVRVTRTVRSARKHPESRSPRLHVHGRAEVLGLCRVLHEGGGEQMTSGLRILRAPCNAWHRSRHQPDGDHDQCARSGYPATIGQGRPGRLSRACGQPLA